ncbi:MAG: DUF481 domain-containing protein [Hyphomonadaceae bacterium]
MKKLVAALIGLAMAGTASAQSTGWADGWSGEGNFGAGITTGNTDTVDIAVGLKLSKDFDPWKVSLEGGYDFGEVDGVDNRNRWHIGGQGERTFNDRWYGFVNASYEEDQFSGFDSRLFVGVGAGYHIFKEKPLTWSVEVAPGYRRSQIADEIIPALPTPIIVTPGFTANDFAVRGSSRFAYDFNENVTFTNDTDVIWTDTSTQTINTAAVTAQLTERISGRVSFEVRNDTNPPDGFVSTDTATRVSVVYGF